MKLLNNKTYAIALVALLSVVSSSFGYNFGISNKTKTPMLVKLKARGGGYQFDVIRPNKRVIFYFKGGDIGLCLESIHYAPVDLTETYQGTNPKLAKYKGKNLLELRDMGAFHPGAGGIEEIYQEVLTPMAEDYALTSAPMKMLPGDVYDATAKSATALVSGLDTLGCKIVEVALAAKTGGASEVLKRISGMGVDEKNAAAAAKKEAATLVGESKKDPSKKPEAEKAIEKANNLNDKLPKLKELDLKLISSGILDDKYEFLETKIPAAIALLEANKALFDNATYTKIKALFDAGKNEAGMDAIQAVITSLTPKEPKEGAITKTSIDDAMIYNGCISCHLDLGSLTGKTSTPAGPKTEQGKTCSFGLGEIAGAIGELVGTSVCKSRDFILIPGGKDEDEVIAITRKGE
jgi:hypothetical protein